MCKTNLIKKTVKDFLSYPNPKWPQNDKIVLTINFIKCCVPGFFVCIGMQVAQINPCLENCNVEYIFLVEKS